MTSQNHATTFVSATLSIHPQVLKPYSISGLVYVDCNNDGEVNFGESGIAGVVVTLSGTNDLGLPVNETVWTDDDGFYKFADLRPGDYHVTESQPEHFLQGINSAGTLDGGVSAIDQFFLQLGEHIFDLSVDTDALNYNFGERPPADGTIEPGQTAGIGFWQNKNGQALVQSLNGGAQAIQLGDWLAATLPNMWGRGADIGWRRGRRKSP
ncbi:MAG: SdrD B-like domain-containing protein [Pirellulaceae bacterium]